MRRSAIGLMLTLVLGIFVAPLTTEAQQSAKIPRIGVLSPGPPPTTPGTLPDLNAFREGLHDLGYREGQNILLEYRYAAWQLDQLSVLATDLVQLAPDIIFTYTTPGALAVKQTTTTIPIVIGAAGDLVGQGIVTSLARPGGNITGLTLLGSEIDGKRLELLKEAVPTISRVAILVNPDNPVHRRLPGDVGEVAQVLGVQLQRVEVRDPSTFDDAFATIVQSHADAVLIGVDAKLNAHRRRLLDLTTKHRLPTVAGERTFAQAGSLMAYDANIADLFRRAAYYVDRILKGARPADLPVEQPTKFELVINLKTAQILGITIPTHLLVLADEVIK